MKQCHATPRMCRGRARRRGERGYSFTQAPFAFEDFTAASTRARPFAPSSMLGKCTPSECTPSGGFVPERAAASATSL